MYNKPSRMLSGGTVSLETAEIIALQAVAFLASDDEALEDLLRLTGLDLESLKTALTDQATFHETLAGVLAVLLESETRLLAFCEATDLSPTVPAAAQRRLAPSHTEF
jgi:hypothetical protein